MAELSEQTRKNIVELTSEEINYIRIANLILRVAPRAVRVRFDQEFNPVVLQKTLNQNRLKLENLKCINNPQRDLLFPNSGKACSKSFDLTLMIFLIRNLTEITVGDVLPVASDTSEGANLFRLKHYRNMIVHRWDGTLSDKKFEKCWTDISQAIVSLGGTSFLQTCSDLKVSRMNNSDEEILKELRNIEISINPVPRGVRKIKGEIIEDWEKDKVAETRAIKRIAELIETQNSVVAVGSSGCGKSTSIHYVALQLYHHQGYDIIPVYSPDDVRQYYDPESKQVFVVDDICGKSAVDENLVNCWGRQLTEIQKMLKDQRIKILSSCKTHIFQNRLFKILSPLFSKSCDLTSDYKLTCDERRDIASIYLTKDDIKLIEGTFCSDLEQQVSLTPFPQFHFFPRLCKIYSTQKLVSICDFFSYPVQVVREDLNLLLNANDQKTIATLMLLIVYNNSINDNLFSRTLSIKQTLEAISDHFHLQQCFSIQCVKSELENLNGSYVKKIGNIHRIPHDIIYEICLLFFGEHKFDLLLDIAHSNIIRDMFLLKSSKEIEKKSEDYVENFIEVKEHNEAMYFGRLKRDISNGFIENVLNNKQMKYAGFRSKILQKIQSELNLKDVINNLRANEISSLLQSIIRQGFSEMFAILIDHVDLNMFGKTCLLIAIDTGSTNIVEQLCDHRVSSDTNVVKITPLYLASDKGYTEIVQLLLECGSNPNISGSEGTPLYLAVKKRHTKIIQLLLIHKADPNYNDDSNKPPLYIASENGDIEIVRLLLNYKADPNIVFSEKKTSPLHTAIENDHIEIADLLLSFNANPYPFDINNKTPLSIALEKGNLFPTLLEATILSNRPIGKEHMSSLLLYYASKYGVTYLIKSILEESNVDGNDNSHNGNKETSLFIASQEGHYDAVSELLHQKCDPNITDFSNMSPLFIATFCGHTDIVKQLLDANGDHNIRSNISHQAPLHIASNLGYKEIVKILLENNCDPNVKDADGKTPVFIAASNGFAEIVKVLLKKGGSPYICNKYNQTPLHKASYLGHSVTVKVLLEHNSDSAIIDKENCCPLYNSIEGKIELIGDLPIRLFDLEIRSWYHKSPLCIATYMGHTEIVKLLLKHNNGSKFENKIFLEHSDNLSTRFSIQNPLLYATWKGRKDIVKLFLECNWDPNITNCDNQTPLYIAAWVNNIEVTKLLLEYESNPDICSKDKKTPLFVASKNGNTEIVKLLLEHNCNPNFVDKHGTTAIYKASCKGHVDTVKLLLEYKSDPNTCNDLGETPLHVSAFNGYVEIVKLLLDVKCNPNMFNSQNEQPVDMAKKRGHTDIVKLLQNPITEVK